MMNVNLKSKLVTLFTIFILICQINDILGFSTGIHIRKGFTSRGGGIIEYKFRDVPEDIGYLTTFPMEKIKQELPNELFEDWKIEYYVFTSIEDTELAMVERNEMSSYGWKNMIDFPLKDGQIGDNCWHELFYGIIRFIRNNVYVSISPKNFNTLIDSAAVATVEWLSREVDTLLIKEEKVDNVSLISAPDIQSVDIISELPQSWKNTVRVKINATDQKSQKLYYRRYGAGFAWVSEDGFLAVFFNKYTDTDNLDDTTKAKVKIWVWNEDNITSSIEKEIPF